MKEQAYAKINVSLDVVSKMDDGYHAVRMIMQSISLCDIVHITCTHGNGVSVKTNLSYIPSDGNNIAAKAARSFYEYTGIKDQKCEIILDKKIPVCAGLGGGSSDAAAVLRAMNRYYETKLGVEKLCEIGSKIGSDVPFCVSGGTMLAEGRGTELTRIAQLPNCYIVICKPPFSISTPRLFAAINCEKIRYRPDTSGIIAALKRNELSGVARRMYNVFEDVLGIRKESIDNIKDTMFECGALGACMSGTGSAVFGIFDNEETAKFAQSELYCFSRDCFIAKPVRELNIE